METSSEDVTTEKVQMDGQKEMVVIKGDHASTSHTMIISGDDKVDEDNERPSSSSSKADATVILPVLIKSQAVDTGNEMLQELPTEQNPSIPISFPQVMGDGFGIEESSEVTEPKPEPSNPNTSQGLLAATDPLRTPPRTLIADRTELTDNIIAPAPLAPTNPPPVVPVEQETEADTGSKDNMDSCSQQDSQRLKGGEADTINLVKIEPSDSIRELDRLDQKIENLKRNKISSFGPMSNHHHVNHSRPHQQPYGHDRHYFTSPSSSHSSRIVNLNSHLSHHQASSHMCPSSNLLTQHPNYYSHQPQRIPPPLHYNRPPHHYDHMRPEMRIMNQDDEDDSLSNSVPSPPEIKHEPMSALNLAMNSYHHQHHHQSNNSSMINTSSYASGTSSPGPASAPIIPSHLLSSSTGHPPPLINRHVSYPGPYDNYNHHQQQSSQPSIMSRQSSLGSGVHFNSLHPDHNTGHHIRNPPTSIPVSVVTSLAQMRQQQILGIGCNPNNHANSHPNVVMPASAPSSSSSSSLMADGSNCTTQVRNNIMNTPVITAGNRRTAPVSVISTGTRTSSRPNVVTGASVGGAGGAESNTSGHQTPDTTPPIQSSGGNRSNMHHRFSSSPSSMSTMGQSRLSALKIPPKASGNPHKPYQCPICSKNLASKNVYQLHLRSHSGEKPFSCHLCSNSFSQKTSLTRHMRSHTGERPYPCPQCDKRFADKERIKIHLRTHTGEKPFSCDVCGKTFSQKSTVKRHMSVHTGEKPYQCPTCGKGFANRGNLTAHVKTHQANHGHITPHPYVQHSSQNHHSSTSPKNYPREPSSASSSSPPPVFSLTSRPHMITSHHNHEAEMKSVHSNHGNNSRVIQHHHNHPHPHNQSMGSSPVIVGGPS